jgi:hypothetical protein
MSKLQILQKNLRLTSKLFDFLNENPEMSKNVPSGTSYVVFSYKDKELNNENQKMITELKGKGKKVVKATNKPGPNPWKLEFLF